MENNVTNIVIAGLGGQGVLKASDILADVVFASKMDVKKSEVHGMSQRGGSVASDVRYGERIFSPMVPPGEADFLVVLSDTQVDVNRSRVKPDGIMIEPSMIDASQIKMPRAVNIGLMGMLSAYLPFEEEAWKKAIIENLPEVVQQVNLDAFAFGRASAAVNQK